MYSLPNIVYRVSKLFENSSIGFKTIHEGMKVVQMAVILVIDDSVDEI